MIAAGLVLSTLALAGAIGNYVIAKRNVAVMERLRAVALGVLALRRKAYDKACAGGDEYTDALESCANKAEALAWFIVGESANKESKHDAG